MEPEEIERQAGVSVRKILEGTREFCPETVDLTEWEVIVIKLAEWLHNMRTLEYMDDTRWKEKAAQAAEYYLPIANKIGCRKLAAELNELLAKYIQ